MGTFHAIAEVSEILRRTLDLGVQPVGATCILHDLIAAPSVGMTLTLTLYEVTEDPSARNRPDIRTIQAGQISFRRSPASLLLRYLITAWSGDIADDQLILGAAVQTMYDRAILSGPDLTGTSLIDRDESVAITMINQTIEDRTHIWRAYEKAYRLSICYEVRVVKIESARPPRVQRPVASRHLRNGTVEELP